MRAVLFRSRMRRVRFEPADGLHVLAFGRLDVYAVRGEYQLVCEVLEPKGLGALQLAFEQLKARLAAEGLFDAGAEAAAPRAAPPRRARHVPDRRGRAGLPAGRHPPLRRPPGPRVPGPRPGRYRGRRDRRGARDAEPPGRSGRDRGGPRRRVPRGPVGVQRGGRRPGDRRVEDPGDLGGRSRDRRDDRRLRGGPPRADALGRRGARRAGEGGAGAPARHAGDPAPPRDGAAHRAGRRPARRHPAPPRPHGSGPAAPGLGAPRGRSGRPARPRRDPARHAQP